MFLSDYDIKHHPELITITPFVDESINRNEAGEPVLSYGLGPAGYDVRLKPKWKIYQVPLYEPRLRDGPHITDLNTPEALETYRRLAGFITDVPEVINPRTFDEKKFLKEIESESIIVWPGQYVLAVTMEHFKVSDSVQGTFFAKSSYARWGLMINTTNVQPGFEGEIVMEFYNAGGYPIQVNANEGFAQVKFEMALTPAERPYGLVGRYQGQRGVQTPIVK